MLFEKQPKKSREDYIELLRIMGSLSSLFSNNDKPYLPYRVTENIFCQCLEAENLSRSDCTADASKDGIGVGIKTFIDSRYQKIAEFNKHQNEYKNLNRLKLIEKISDFRNERIEVTMRKHSLTNMIYHYTYRDTAKISILECNLEKIDINSIQIDKATKNIIYFNDGLNQYSFNKSKSTLFKRFETGQALSEIDIQIIDNPYTFLREIYKEKLFVSPPIQKEFYPYVILPLYSTRTKTVAKHSGLNQWNAGGRKRHENEVYIPVPSRIHVEYPNFFPKRDEVFSLKLPNKQILQAKLCQENSKALMSNPNKDLGEWLLRDVLRLKVGELVTFDTLERAGIDSAIVYKLDKNSYSIDFNYLGGYERFINESNDNEEDDEQ
jgi:hypothetical protein